MGIFLFSIDLEDVRDRVPGGERYRERVPEMTERYLRFLSDHHAKATFFTVGDIARKYPSLVRSIALEGHEIACHSDKHITLDKQDPVSFKTDLQRCLEALDKAGAGSVKGYRAPTFSLTERTGWAHRVLAEAGFIYSSSVLPTSNPLFGWPGFARSPGKIDGILEIPMTLGSFIMGEVPFGGGVYFRALPFSFIKRKFKKTFAAQLPVLGYFHPYDIDTGQERFMHPEISNNPVFNFLLYYNRSKTLPRLEKILGMGAEIITYRTYAERILAVK